jgi:hypothetical protein
MSAATTAKATYRIVSTREIAPGWFGAPVEVGETASATVAVRYCDEQNAMSMDPNRPVRKQFYVEPIV